MNHISIWSKEYIDAHPSHMSLSKTLIPWLKGQIRDIEEEVKKAAPEVRKLQEVLAEAEAKLTQCKDDKERKLCAGAIESIQASISRSDLTYLNGRIYMLEQHIKGAT
jgi:flagellar biosynthesis chaperone FliJ